MNDVNNSFEKWAVDNGSDVAKASVTYSDKFTQALWTAWQAAWSASLPEPVAKCGNNTYDHHFDDWDVGDIIICKNAGGWSMLTEDGDYEVVDVFDWGIQIFNSNLDQPQDVSRMYQDDFARVYRCDVQQEQLADILHNTYDRDFHHWNIGDVVVCKNVKGWDRLTQGDYYKIVSRVDSSTVKISSNKLDHPFFIGAYFREDFVRVYQANN